jgi:hypothetical protein
MLFDVRKITLKFFHFTDINSPSMPKNSTQSRPDVSVLPSRCSAALIPSMGRSVGTRSDSPISPARVGVLMVYAPIGKRYGQTAKEHRAECAKSLN